MSERITDWIQAISAFFSAVLSGALIWYAKVTIDEGKKNRRISLIVPMLEKFYSPLSSILATARLASNGQYYLMSKETYEYIRKTLYEYGCYYIHPSTNIFTSVFRAEGVEGDLIRIPYKQLITFDIIVQEIQKKLRKELDKLAPLSLLEKVDLPRIDHKQEV